MALISEAEWEQVALEVLAEQGWQPTTGAEIAGERSSLSEVVLTGRVQAAARRLNPAVPEVYLRQGVTEILTPASTDAISEARRLHQVLVEGYRGVSWIDHDGVEQNPTIRLIGSQVADNDWLAVHQLKIADAEHHRRFDLVGFVNGLPVLIAELKQAGIDVVLDEELRPLAEMIGHRAVGGGDLAAGDVEIKACIVHDRRSLVRVHQRVIDAPQDAPPASPLRPPRGVCCADVRPHGGHRGS